MLADHAKTGQEIKESFLGARKWQDGLHNGGEGLIRRFRRPEEIPAKHFDVGTQVWIVTGKIIKHLPGFVGAASTSR